VSSPAWWTTRAIVPPHPLEALVLQHPEELRLERRPDVADLVKEHGPPVGDLELAALLLVGAGEGAPLVAEQLRLEELLGQGHVVDDHERPRRPEAPGSPD